MRRRGLSLFETVFACGILGLLVLAVLRLLPGAALSVRHTEHSLEAQGLAEATLEKLRAGGFSAATLGAVDLPPVTVGPIQYKIHREVFQAAGVDTKYLRGLRATVSWEYRGQTRQIVRESWLSVVKS